MRPAGGNGIDGGRGVEVGAGTELAAGNRTSSELRAQDAEVRSQRRKRGGGASEVTTQLDDMGEIVHGERTITFHRGVGKHL